MYILIFLYLHIFIFLLIGPQGPVPPIWVKSIFWGLGHMELQIPTKFDFRAGILILINTIKNYTHLSTGSGTSHISQIGKLGSWAHGTSDSHQIWYLGLYTNSKCDYQKLSWLVHRVRYLPYKSNKLNIWMRRVLKYRPGRY